MTDFLAGRRQHQVILQSATATRDGAGAEVVTWGTVATVWGVVEPLSGREYWAAQQQAAEMSYRVRIRYRAGVLPTWRVLYGSRVFLVLSVIDVNERHEEMQLMCREIV